MENFVEAVVQGGNVTLMVETEERLSDLRQGEHSVLEYVATVVL
jgi:hypothetical protein